MAFLGKVFCSLWSVNLSWMDNPDKTWKWKHWHPLYLSPSLQHLDVIRLMFGTFCFVQGCLTRQIRKSALPAPDQNGNFSSVSSLLVLLWSLTDLNLALFAATSFNLGIISLVREYWLLDSSLLVGYHSCDHRNFYFGGHLGTSAAITSDFKCTSFCAKLYLNILPSHNGT